MQATIFAATAFTTLIPFLLLVGTWSSRDVVAALSRSIGLNRTATNDLRALFLAHGVGAESITVTAVLFSVVGVLGMAATLQRTYEHLYGLSSHGRRDLHRQVAWIGLVVAVLLGVSAMRQVIARAGRVGATVIAIAILFGVWFFTSWIMLAGRRPVRALYPPAIATTLLCVGLKVVSDHVFSRLVVQNKARYGQIGVTFALLSWLFAIGVVIVLGVVFGEFWGDRVIPWWRAQRGRRARLADEPGEGHGSSEASSCPAGRESECGTAASPVATDDGGTANRRRNKGAHGDPNAFTPPR